MESSAIQWIVQWAGGRLITGLALGVLLAPLAGILLRACRSSSTRFAIWLLTLLTIAVLPLAACLRIGHRINLSAAPRVILPDRWALGVFAVWLLGAGIGLSRIVMGLYGVWRIRRRSFKLEASSLSEARPGLMKTLAESRVGRNVSLCISEDVAVPTATGFFRPTVLLPSWVTTELSRAELDSILLHELGHLKRWDDWTNLGQKVVRALLFFHPAVWWIDSRLSLEREMACDEFVVAKTSDARGYARCLVSVAEKSVGRRAFTVAVAAVSRVRETAARLARILEQNRPAKLGVSKPAFAGFAVLMIALMVELPRIPTMVVFREAAPQQATLAPDLGPATIAGDAQPVPKNVPTAARERSFGSDQATLRKVELRTRLPLSSGPRKLASQTRTRRTRGKRGLPPSPMLVRASWKDETRAPLLLLVTQMVACDSTGTCVVSLGAWQMSTIERANPTQAGIGTRSNSI